MYDKPNLFCFVHSSRSLHQINTAPYESYHRKQHCLNQEGREKLQAYLQRVAGNNLHEELWVEKSAASSESLSTHKAQLKGHPANGPLDSHCLQ